MPPRPRSFRHEGLLAATRRPSQPLIRPCNRTSTVGQPTRASAPLSGAHDHHIILRHMTHCQLPLRSCLAALLRCLCAATALPGTVPVAHQPNLRFGCDSTGATCRRPVRSCTTRTGCASTCPTTSSISHPGRTHARRGCRQQRHGQTSCARAEPRGFKRWASDGIASTSRPTEHGAAGRTSSTWRAFLPGATSTSTETHRRHRLRHLGFSAA